MADCSWRVNAGFQISKSFQFVVALGNELKKSKGKAGLWMDALQKRQWTHGESMDLGQQAVGSHL